MLKLAGMLPDVKNNGSEPVPSLKTCRISYVVLGNIPAMNTFVLFSGTTARVSVFRHAGCSPATANCTNTVFTEEGGTLYNATSGLAVRVTTACNPVTRDITSSVTTAVVVSIAS